MSISANFFHAFKTDRRLFWGAVAGLGIGNCLELKADIKILKQNRRMDATKNDDIHANLRFKIMTSLAVQAAGLCAYHFESRALAAVGVVGVAATAWFNYQIGKINEAHNLEDPKIQRAVNFNYLGMALKWAVPVTVFSWHVIQSFRGK